MSLDTVETEYAIGWENARQAHQNHGLPLAALKEAAENLRIEAAAGWFAADYADDDEARDYARLIFSNSVGTLAYVARAEHDVVLGVVTRPEEHGIDGFDAVAALHARHVLRVYREETALSRRAARKENNT